MKFKLLIGIVINNIIFKFKSPKPVIYPANRGIKHDFQFINIRKVQREVLNDKIMFDLYYAPNFEKVGSILLLACASVSAFVRPFKKNLKLGF